MSNHLKICYIPYDGRERNNIAFSPKFESRWTNILKSMLEEQGHSIATYDINTIETSDVILCFDNVYHQNNRHFMKIYKSHKLGDTIHIDYEPPSANCRIHNNSGLKLLSNLFRALITYNDDVVNNDTIVKGCIGDFLEGEKKYRNDFNNRKFICIIANYRGDIIPFERHKDELYSQRKAAVSYFQKKCPNEFDLYGAFWPDDLQVCLKGTLNREKKMETLSEYKFIVSYDSIKNQRGYISEKIFDCFNAKIVPVYWGADNVTNYIPKECFVDKRDFNTYDELYEYLKNMTEEEYNQRVLAIEKYLSSQQYKELFSSQASAKIIYDQIMRPTRNVNYPKAIKILNSFERKRTTDPRYNSDNFYFETAFNNNISSFVADLKEDGYNLKFRLNLNDLYDPEFFIKTKDQIIPLEAQREDIGNRASAWYFYMSYNNLLKLQNMKFFVKDKNSKEVKILNIDTDPYINQINCNDLYRMQAKNNMLFLIRNSGNFFNFYMKLKPIRSIYINRLNSMI